MAVGDGSLIGGLSYFAIGRETSFGTGVTTTAQIDFLSTSLSLTKEAKILEQVERRRVHKKHFRMSKTVEGDLETYFYPLVTSAGYLLQAAFANPTVSSATATGETAGGTAFTHTYSLGSFAQATKSLSANVRYGDSTAGKIYEYSGLRVNEVQFSGEIDEPMKVTYSFMGKDATITTNDIESALTCTSAAPLSFVNGRLSVESTFASLTSTSFWHVQSVNLTMTQNLKGDTEARRIGSDTVQVMPAGMANIQMTATIRFDTTTAYAAMVNETQFAAELEFLGDTMSTSVIREGLTLEMPKIYVNTSTPPEIGGPDEILTSEVTFDVMTDDSSASGYAIRALLTNNISSV